MPSIMNPPSPKTKIKMLEIIPKTKIDFIGKRYIFFTISAILLLSSLFSLIMKKGPKWGLDFTGGTLTEFQFKNPPSLDEIRKALLQKNIPPFEIQTVPNEGIFIIRTQFESKKESVEETTKTDEVGKIIELTLQEKFPDSSPMLLRKEFVGPTVGRHLGRQTALAFFLTFLGIIVYVAFRFHSGIWGAAGIIALIHDVFATVGIFSIANKDITVTIVAALLAIAGYSINDTIVIFDYMREQMRLRRTESQAEVINRSLNETLSRTIITNLTVFLVVLTLFFFGGEVIHDFAFAMVFGALIGTYSTIAISAPLIYEWELTRSKRK